MRSKQRAVEGARDGGALATRKRLLDAAVECLIEFGVAGTTTLAVQHRADVSRGALLHHFPSHATLLAATVAELVARNEKAVSLSQSDLRASRDPLDAAVRSLAFAARQPAYLAELELWAVARTDASLKQALIAAERAARRDFDRVHSNLFGKWIESDAYDDVVSLTQHFMRGLAISENIRSSPQRRERLIAAWTKAMRSMLEKGSENRADRKA
jgi:AcrR family transcriptional regulator